MLILTSPAKTLDFDQPYPSFVQPTQPQFLSTSQEIHLILKSQTKPKLQKILKVSKDITQLNYQRLQDWTPDHNTSNARPTLWTYKGDIYKQMDVVSYTRSQIEYAQQSLRMISGLYGLLRPFDLIQPYRLEMITNLPRIKPSKLNQFWRPILTKHLHQEITQNNHQVVINLASKAYADAIDFKQLSIPVINIIFKDLKNGKLQIIPIFAKQTRGVMIDWLIKNRVTDQNQIRKAEVNGYIFDSKLSTNQNFIYTR